MPLVVRLLLVLATPLPAWQTCWTMRVPSRGCTRWMLQMAMGSMAGAGLEAAGERRGSRGGSGWRADGALGGWRRHGGPPRGRWGRMALPHTFSRVALEPDVGCCGGKRFLRQMQTRGCQSSCMLAMRKRVLTDIIVSFGGSSQDLSMADRHPSLWEGEDTAGYSTGGSGRPGSSHADATHPNARQQYDDSSVARRSPRRTRSFTELQDSTYSSAGDTPTADHEGARGSGTSPAPQPPPTYGSAHDSSAAVQAPAVPVAARHRRHASADLSLLEVVQRGGGRGRPGASGDSEGGARSSGRETGSARDLGLASMLAARGGATAVGSGGFSSRLSRPGAAGGGTAAHGGPEAGAGQGEIQPFGGTMAHWVAWVGAVRACSLHDGLPVRPIHCVPGAAVMYARFLCVAFGSKT